MIRCLLVGLATVAGCRSQPLEAALQEQRLACAFQAGAMPIDTFSGPIHDQLPFDHIVLVMQENRSFDHYFSKLVAPDITVASTSVTLLDSAGHPTPRFHEGGLCNADQDHGWTSAHHSWNHGLNDGFVTAADPNGVRSMGYYDETELPYYYALARSFAISDHHFCSALGPTWPNRLFFMAGTSFGTTGSQLPSAIDDKGHPYPNLFSRLNDAGVSWKYYTQDIPTVAILSVALAANLDHFAPYAQYFIDAAAGQLPSFTVVEGEFNTGGASADEHPPSDIEIGQNMVSHVISALAASPHWPKSVFFLTYDENGGFYDSVPPPAACPPDDFTLPVDNKDTLVPFDHDGFRVPFIAVSPFVKRGYVSHQTTDHTSLLRFIEARFNLPALTKRDANSAPLDDLFDYDHPNYDFPILPAVSIDSTQAAYCAATYPNGS